MATNRAMGYTDYYKNNVKSSDTSTDDSEVITPSEERKKALQRRLKMRGMRTK